MMTLAFSLLLCKQVEPKLSSDLIEMRRQRLGFSAAEAAEVYRRRKQKRRLCRVLGTEVCMGIHCVNP